jgi:hypothetical protein
MILDSFLPLIYVLLIFILFLFDFLFGILAKPNFKQVGTWFIIRAILTIYHGGWECRFLFSYPCRVLPEKLSDFNVPYIIISLLIGVLVFYVGTLLKKLFFKVLSYFQK